MVSALLPTTPLPPHVRRRASVIGLPPTSCRLERVTSRHSPSCERVFVAMRRFIGWARRSHSRCRLALLPVERVENLPKFPPLPVAEFLGPEFFEFTRFRVHREG